MECELRETAGRATTENNGAALAAATLAWWREAGIDTLVADTPRSWLTSQAEPAPQAEKAAPAPVPAPSLPRQSSADDALLLASPTLDIFLQKLREENPDIPVADGNPASGVMIIGEGPGSDDLRSGRPFTGPAGRFLDRMLAAIGLSRENCYISLVAPRRLIPGPVPVDALAADHALTLRHIELVQPRALLLLGAAPVQTLVGNRAPIGKQRGTWAEVRCGDISVPALASYNPAYMLRRPDAKREAWADLLTFRRSLPV